MSVVSVKRPVAGVYLIATPRFFGLGDPTDIVYDQLIQATADRVLENIGRHSDIVFPGIISKREHVRSAIDQFHAAHVDSVYCLFLSWTEDFAWAQFVRDMPPVPLFFAQPTLDMNYVTTWERDGDFARFLSISGLVGSLEGSGSIAKIERPNVYVSVGDFEDVMAEYETYNKACALKSALFSERFALLANFNEVMWSTYVDPYLFYQKAGPEFRFLSVAELEDEVAKVPEEDVKECVRLLEERYPKDADVDDEKFAASVRGSLAMEALIKKNNLGALILNDVSVALFEHIGLRPGFCPTPIGPQVPVIPEGDMGAGLAVYVLKHISGEHVTMVEPFHIDSTDGCLMVGHGGPNDYTDPKGSMKISRDVRFAKSKYRYAGAPFAWYVIPEGEKTVLHISQSNGTYKLIVTLADGIKDEHRLASYTHGKLKLRSGTAEEYIKKLMKEGVTQHYAVAAGNHIEKLRMFADIMGFEYHEF